ncbi:lysophospholipid acyltransferase family protein [Actinoplanes sp. TBRC 11911]|uniref:lysophospholipid acyltransferase family protein n=1 Tax=Actinoplanes sp. TBRC 11911 TaxID=2729386 RepID=UPI002007169E|nr:lysophospholipid acyltransferase family protein [Actinoplanes sp. TBRC 11911]
MYWLAHSGIAVAGRTPPRVRHAVASTVTSASYLGWRSKRLATQENMAKVLGLPDNHIAVRRAALRSWSNYGRTAAQLICLPYLNIVDIDAHTEDLTEGMTWREGLASALGPGKGAIVTTGHFGSWDLAGAIAAQHVRLSAVADTFKDPRLDNLLQGHRRDNGVDIIPALSAPRRAVQELADGRVVAIVIDRPVSARHGVEVTFFGHTAYVPAGAATMAVKSGAAVVPGYFWHAPSGGYRIRVFPPMFPRSDVDRRQEVRRLTQYMVDCQEEIVRQTPTQWFMFRRFWPSSLVAAA